METFKKRKKLVSFGNNLGWSSQPSSSLTSRCTISQSVTLSLRFAFLRVANSASNVSNAPFPAATSTPSPIFASSIRKPGSLAHSQRCEHNPSLVTVENQRQLLTDQALEQSTGSSFAVAACGVWSCSSSFTNTWITPSSTPPTPLTNPTVLSLSRSEARISLNWVSGDALSTNSFTAFSSSGIHSPPLLLSLAN